MQIHVNHVETHVAGFYFSKNCVQVCTIVIKQAAHIMHNLLDVLYLLFEYTQRRRIGQHQTCCLRPDSGAQCVEVHIAVAVSGNLFYGVTTHYRRGRIGAVCRVRDDDLGARRVTA